jgi:hypothetical protein
MQGCLRSLGVTTLVGCGLFMTDLPTPRPVSGQEVLHVQGDERSCHECRLVIASMTMLQPGSTAGGRFSGLPKSIIQRANEDIVVTLNSSDFAPFVFDVSGRETGRLLPPTGSSYKGPTSLVLLPNDTIVVVDAAARRGIVFNKENEAVRTRAPAH